MLATKYRFSPLNIKLVVAQDRNNKGNKVSLEMVGYHGENRWYGHL